VAGTTFEIRLSEISRQSIANFPQISTKAAQSTVFPVRNLLRVDKASPHSSAQDLWLPKPLCCWRANLACLMESLRTLSDRDIPYSLQSYADFSRLRERENGFCYELVGGTGQRSLSFFFHKSSADYLKAIYSKVGHKSVHSQSRSRSSACFDQFVDGIRGKTTSSKLQAIGCEN
jgi:hypothetical protein